MILKHCQKTSVQLQSFTSDSHKTLNLMTLLGKYESVRSSSDIVPNMKVRKYWGYDVFMHCLLCMPKSELKNAPHLQNTVVTTWSSIVAYFSFNWKIILATTSKDLQKHSNTWAESDSSELSFEFTRNWRFI